ncbi:unnamed protein product [Linum trigynum]|uniref:RNase H type-1 domain-containing protein n=1 Tax=Linum trigynum TaxID=586398 RepID=A0AAV2CRF9_9ROSI
MRHFFPVSTDVVGAVPTSMPPSCVSSVSLWPPPGMEYAHRIFFDGATASALGSIGVVVTDDHGTILQAFARQYPNTTDSLIIEALALRDAIMLCSQQHWRMGVFLGDAKTLIDLCNNGVVQDARIGAILLEIRHLLRSQDSFQVRFVGRDRNRAAHLVARHALLVSPYLFLRTLLVGYVLDNFVLFVPLN